MLMNRNEYHRFKKQYELLGNIETARKNQQHLQQKILPEFLMFLEQIFEYHNKNFPSQENNNLEIKIMVRKTLNRLTKDAFNIL